MEPVGLALGILGAGGALYFAYVRSRDITIALVESWADAAKRLGGRSSPAEFTWWRPNDVTLSVMLGRVPLRARTTQGKEATTRITAPVPTRTFSMRLYTEDVLSGLGKSIGLVDDIQLGDAQFDATWVVSASDEALVRAWLTRRLQRMMLGNELRLWSYRIHAGTLEVERAGTVDDPRELVAVVRVAAALAERAHELVDEWSRVASALGGQLVEEQSADRRARETKATPCDLFAPIHVAYGGAHVRIAIERPSRKRALGTCLHAYAPGDAFAELDGLVFDEDALRAALVDVASRAAGPGGGAYR